jgi:hypothetical protein
VADAAALRSAAAAIGYCAPVVEVAADEDPLLFM